MMDILKKTIRNRFRIITSIFTKKPDRFSFKQYVSSDQLITSSILEVSILLDDFLDYPEKSDLDEILKILNYIECAESVERNSQICHHTSILKRDIETFYIDFFEKNKGQHLRDIEIFANFYN